MAEIIAALQEEIAAARVKVLATEPDTVTTYGQSAWLRGYIQGLQTAVDLLTKEPVPFTAENGDCSFMENGDLR